MSADLAPRTSRRSVLGQALEPLAATLWIAFWLWTAFIAVLWLGGIDEVEVAGLIKNAGLREAVVRLLAAADACWLILAATNVYAALVRDEGLATARRWAGYILLGSMLIAGCNALSEFPLGPLRYTTRLGMKLGPVPLALPFLWLVIIIGSRELVVRCFTRASHVKCAAGAALFSLLTVVNLEPVAWRLRAWWIWYPRDASAPQWPPFQNYLAWTIASFALAFFLREKIVGRSPAERSWRPILALLAFNLLFLAANVARFA